jgi:flagellar hook-length control protein FliK
VAASTPADNSFQESLASARKKQSSSASKPTKAANAIQTPVKSATKQPKAKAAAVVNESIAKPDKNDTAATVDEPVTNEDESPDQGAAPVAADTTDTKQQAASVAIAKDATDAVAIAPVPVTKVIAVPAAVQQAAPLKPEDRKTAAVKATVAKPLQDSQAVAAAPVQKTTTTDAAPQPQAKEDPDSDNDAKAVAVKPADSGAGKADSAEEADTDTDAAQPKTKPKAAATSGAADDAAQTASALPEVLSADSGTEEAPDNATPVDASGVASSFEQQLQKVLSPLAPKAEAPAPPQQGAETQFADANHPSIVTSVHTNLLPNGGTMQLKLDPPDLGALQVTVQMRDGVMTAAFETSNEQATRMLSHSLNQLKTALETSGISVERMHVQQAPRQESKGNSQGDSQQQKSQDPEQQQQSRQEQQRRQMLQRMWNKLNGVADPLDLVA